MTMGKKVNDNNNNNSSNKLMKSWSFRRQYLRNINTSLYNNNARLCVLESNRCAKVKDIFHFFCEDNNALHWNGSRFKGWLSSHMECGLKIGVYSVPWWASTICGQARYLMYYENNVENQFYLHVMNIFTRGSKKF